MANFLKGINSLQKVNFGMKHLWDVKFIDPELIGPFKEWFPASNVKLDLFNVQSYNFKTNIGTASIPATKVVGDNGFDMTFYDDERGSIEEWMEDWVEEVMFAKSSGNYSVTGTLDECTRVVQLKRLNSRKEDIKGYIKKKDWTRSVGVYPEGTLSFLGESDMGMHIYAMNFKIVAYVEDGYY